MNTISIDFSKVYGKVKPFNAVNNGPVKSLRGINNMESWKALNIPYGRLHDTSFQNEWLVDVHRIFRDFDADETDPQNYIFAPTDSYLANMFEVGTKPYFRLGASIEHSYKFGTYPPKDYLKWSRICEHIIRHYTEGWADGFEYDIEYWEIWNEADNDNATGNPCWQGTREEFFELFAVSCKYLQEKFPNLKIGGPAIATFWHREWCDEFFKYISERDVKPDFISYHRYRNTPEDFREYVREANAVMAKYGYKGVETHLNEWNYVRGWRGDDFIHSVKSIKGIKGASFVTAVWSVLHPEKIDMMMYYDARPCAFNGLFETTYLEPLKTYHLFKAYDHLVSLGNAVESSDDENIYSIGATNGKSSALLFTYFTEADNAMDRLVEVDLRSITVGATFELYLLDEEHDLTLVGKSICESSEAALKLTLKPYTTYLIKIIGE